MIRVDILWIFSLLFSMFFFFFFLSFLCTPSIGILTSLDFRRHSFLLYLICVCRTVFLFCFVFNYYDPMIWAPNCWPWPLWLSPQSEMLQGHTAFCVTFSMSATIATKNSTAQHDSVEILPLFGLIWLIKLFLYLSKWMVASLMLGFSKIFLVFWGLIFMSVSLFLYSFESFVN